MSRIAVLTGAGVSAESGIKTFRDADGLWEGHDVTEVASPAGWLRNRAKVLEFYNQRRRQLHTVEPNAAHVAIARLEKHFHCDIITQNIDDLHERAGSSSIVHLHGELLKARSTGKPDLIYDWPGDILEGDTCQAGYQLRPHIVWFGEDVPEIIRAAELVSMADTVIIIGTSMQVYPAAGLVAYAPAHAAIYYVDPAPTISHELMLRRQLHIIDKTATAGVPELVDQLIG